MTRIRVTPRDALHVSVGSTTIVASAGTFSRSGTLVVSRQLAQLKPFYAVRAAGPGVDIRVLGTKLLKPVTLTYRVGRQPQGFQPRVAHRTDGGKWELKRASLTPSGRLVVETRSFSINLPSWFNPGAWLNQLKSWAQSAGNVAASLFFGRTPPLSNCGAAAPSWFSAEKLSDMVHTCTIDNAGRGEVQLKSNRGITLEVTVPGSPAYIWVEGQPDWLRRAMGRAGIDPNRTVLLRPGARMTVGYARPASTSSGEFRVAADSGLALADTTLRVLLRDVLPGNLLRNEEELLLLVAWADCGEQFVNERNIVAAVGKFAGCMLGEIATTFKDPAKALPLVQRLGGDAKSASELVAAAKKVSVAGRVIELWPLIQATVIHDIDDSIRALVKDGNDRVIVRLQGSAQSSPEDRTSPSTPAGLSVSAQTSTSFRLTWSASSDNVGVTGYNVFLNGARVGSTSSTNFDFGGRACGTSYSVGVSAFDGAGNTSDTASRTGSTTACSGGSPTRVHPYDNYGAANAGRAMCRGNPDNSSSMPGGVVTQTFGVPAGTAAIDEALVQVDPDSRVTAHADLLVNGSVRASTAAQAAGDTTFTFARVSVSPGDTVTLRIRFSATFGKIITVYTAGNPGGQFATANSCPDGAPSVSLTSTGLRAVVRGWTS